jgi:hypothetical protein
MRKAYHFSALNGSPFVSIEGVERTKRDGQDICRVTAHALGDSEIGAIVVDMTPARAAKLGLVWS